MSRRAADFSLKPQYLTAIRWSRHGACGNPGCTDPECGCSLCGLPIGTDEEDPRWEHHDEFCAGCDLCRDQVPIMLFRGKGKQTAGARFHGVCFQKLTHWRSQCRTEGS